MDYQSEHKGRYLILKGLYERGARADATGVPPADLGRAVALSPEASETAAAQLKRAGLVECAADGSLVRLSDEGLRTVERVLRQPLRSTDSYPDVTDFDDDKRGTRSIDEVDAFLLHLRQISSKLKLDDRSKEELETRILRVESELARPCPSRVLTLAGLASIRDILELAAEGDGIVLLARITHLIDEETAL